MTKIEKITSRDNARLKYARRVRDGREDDAIFVEGLRLAEDAKLSGVSLRDCFVTSRALKNDRVQSLVATLLDNGIKIHEVPAELFSTIADTDSPQGILLICDKPDQSRKMFEKKIHSSTKRIPAIIFLEEVSNPSNLGAILRTAEAAGATGVIISKNSADPFSPKSLRASMGSAFRLPLWSETNLDKVIEWAKGREMIVTAADLNGDKSYTQVDWNAPRLLVFGSEAHGLSDADKSEIEDLIRIPIDPTVESLNLAVSAGVILFEARRQLSIDI